MSKEAELIEHLIKENAFVINYGSSKAYEIGEADVQLIAKSIVKKLDLHDVSWRSELLISFSEYLHKRDLLNVVKKNIPIRVKLFLKRN